MQLKTLFLSLSLALLGTPSFATSCLDDQVNQVIQSKDLDKLESLLATMADCPKDFLDQIAQTLAAQADSLTQQGELAQAKKWLQYAPTKIWATLVAKGNIAAHQKKWQRANKFYNKALDLIADSQATPQAPSQAKIQEIFQLASEAQILAGHLVASISRSGEARGVMRDNIRGFEPKKRLLPVQFSMSQSQLSEKGEKVAQRLTLYIKRYDFIEVTLIGHMNPESKDCACVSERRAQTLKTYLLRADVRATIRTGNKGKREPLKVSNPNKYTPIEIEKLNQRIELVVE